MERRFQRGVSISPASTATDSPPQPQQPARMKKGVQQDEVDISNQRDEAEANAVVERRRPRASATSRAALGGAPPMSAHGAHYTARVARPMSPGKAQRLAAQTARREAEDRMRREQERARKEKARKAAMRAGKQRAEEEAREKERRRQAREAQWEQQQFGEMRDRIAAEAAARAGVPSLGALSLPPTEKQIRRRKMRNRPEWGEGHAGGNRIRMQGSSASTSQLQRIPWGGESGESREEGEVGDDGDDEEEGSVARCGSNASSPPGGADTSPFASSSSPSPTLLSMMPPLGGGSSSGGAPVFKLALPQREESKAGFTQWQEWKFGAVPKPKAAQASVPRRTGVQPEPSRPGAEPIEAWRTPEPRETLPVELPKTSAPWLNWFVEAAADSSPDSGAADGAEGADWQQRVQRADASGLTNLLREVCESDEAKLMHCLTAARAMLLAPRSKKLRAYEGPHIELGEAGFATHIVAAMRAFPLHEALQFTGCELIGLLANHYYGLEQTIFQAGALDACLAACQAFIEERLRAEEVLGAAFQAIHNLCVAEETGDKEGCRRKQLAVEAGALETIHEGMGLTHEKWIQQAGKLAIGCLCKGMDPHGQVRRKRAHALFKLNR